MLKPGYILLIAGFLAGAYATALDVESVNWAMFLPAAVAAAVGLGILKQSARGAAQAEHVLTANRAILESSLDRVIKQVQAIAGMRRDSTGLSTDELRREIDSRLREDFRRFVEVRESLVHLYGIQAYADVMSEFAAGERAQRRPHREARSASPACSKYVRRIALLMPLLPKRHPRKRAG